MYIHDSQVSTLGIGPTLPAPPTQRPGAGYLPTSPRCRNLVLRIPRTYPELEDAVRNWIATCVMSRTESRGAPIHRERGLVNGNATLADIWARILRHRIGQEATIIPEYIGGPNRVESIRFTTNATPPAPACAYDIRNAVAIETGPARATLDLSGRVARQFIQTLGALGARGRFVPTVVDNKYYFAKLYELITYFELSEISRFRHPAFLLHFIPIFYDLYYRALQNWSSGNRASVSPLWTTHFTRAARPNNSSALSWMNDVRESIVT